jgi:predicted acyltransferase
MSSSQRSEALDALRGIAILLMVFSGLIPFGVLPDWMYHAQVPPPKHVFDGTLPGITWVDLVFPWFLFALGAAIPLALEARLVQGVALPSISWGIVKRGAMLFFFAVFVQHLKPALMSATPGAAEQLKAIAGFLALFPIFATLPVHWKARTRLAVRAAGWGIAIALLATYRAKDGSGFSFARSDIILLVLANVAVSGGFVWLATRNRLDWRVGILAFLLALRLTQALPGWGQWAWNLSPWPWLGTVYFQQYLFIVIPGTLAGDLLLRWRSQPIGVPPLSEARPLGGLVWMALILVPLLLIGLKGRWVVETTFIAALLCVAALSVAQRLSASWPVLAALARWGVFWLLLGLAFEPFEGGIRKDRGTLSYYFVTSGLAFFVLAALLVAIDVWKRRAPWSVLAGAGKNPLVAYVAAGSFLLPLLALTGANTLIDEATRIPAWGVVRAAVYTSAVALLASALARRRVLLKA